MSLNSTWCLTRSDRKHVCPIQITRVLGRSVRRIFCPLSLQIPRRSASVCTYRPREKYPPYRLPARLIRILEIRISQISPRPGVQRDYTEGEMGLL